MRERSGSISADEIVADIRQVALELSCTRLSRSEYLRHGHFSYYQIYDGGRTWEELCVASGVSTKKKEPVPDDVYFLRLQGAIESLGRYPKNSERKKLGLNFSKRRYSTLGAFIEQALRRGIIEPEPLSAADEREAGNRTTGPSYSEQRSDPPVISQLPAATRAVPPIPERTKRVRWERTGIEGFPYAPQDESGVVALFAILCRQRHIE